ncbi:type I restriction-modification system subunit M [Bifidobacterium avesanii]|uniref:site-specific DNA-methyltransferase (adenine-specific) n=1 Tax=Bifidobacterium avesanii TaxID=1798157 RepID=A0A7K3THP3_9BIFI|nr:class I SAM-dependent DNA methyltransferase [Bifidobacterium avesanii]KAB8293651.1 restriction endonuclease subunit M [Bifidobacterium avesanii]NEG78214.1 N-6 DNA methylase [Bifidobacterium avesanii]
MNHQSTVAFIWAVADLLRGDYKQHEYGDIILPFTVLRRLDCVLAGTKEQVLEADKMTAGMTPDIADFQLKTVAGLPFYNTSKYTMAKLRADPDNIAANLGDYVRGFSPDARDVFEKFDFFARIDSLDANNLLFQIVDKFCSVKLGPDEVSDIEMGSIYENLLRRFSEMSNETAGEHFSPRDGLELAVDLLIAGASSDLEQPGKVVNVYDPCAGTGGALSIFKDRVNEYYPNADVYCYGQELNAATFATCKADMLLRGGDAGHVAFGNTLTEPAFANVQFGYQISNPPYGVDWKKSKREVEAEYRNEGFKGRFGAGLPRVSDGQLLFIEHMVSKMRPVGLGGGRIAVFMNGSPLFTGAAGSGESDIRKWLLDDLDVVEAIVAMPNDFFYNTGIATYIWVMNNNKPAERKRKVQLINANGVFTKMRKSLGSKRNELSAEQIRAIVQEYTAFEETKTSKIFDVDDFGYTTVTVERPLRDEHGDVVTDRKGNPKPDASLRDTENIPLKQDIDEYFEREVKPYAPDAWMDRKKDKVGYEIPFTRYFYEYTPLRPSAAILDDIRSLEASIAESLAKVGL